MNRKKFLGMVMGILGLEGLVLLEHHKHLKEKESKKWVNPNIEELLKKTPLIWVVDNCDPNYKENIFRKAEDKLIVYNVEGDCLASYLGINFCQSGCGNNAICVLDKQGRRAAVCENAGDRMSFYELMYSGLEKKGEIKIPISAVDISDNGLIYCLENRGNIFGERTLAINPQTKKIVNESFYRGVDIIVNDEHDSVWVAGGDFNSHGKKLYTRVSCLDRNLMCKFVVESNGNGAGSIDYLNNGFAWATEYRKIIKISTNERIVDSIDFPISPVSLSVDRRNDSVWVCAGNNFYKFNSNGEKLMQRKFKTPHCIRVIPTDSSVIVAGKEGVKRYSTNGDLIFSITGLSDDYTKFIGVSKQD